jgi:hypothetical protein
MPAAPRRTRIRSPAVSDETAEVSSVREAEQRLRIVMQDPVSLALR